MAISSLDKNDVSQLVSFKLGIEEYAIDISNVQEIIKMPEITKVPKAPYYVEGVVNLRGNILPIIDTRKRFDMEEFELMGSTRIVVTNLNEMTVGLIVDSVSEVLRIDLRKIDPPPSILVDSSSAFLRGIGKLNNGKRLISILELEKVLHTESFMDEEEEDSDSGKLGSFKSGKEEVKVVEECQMISFQMGKEEYGVDIGLVDEIIRIPAITTVPDAPMHMKGIICLRGKVLPVISLRSLFGMYEKENDNRSRILVIKLSDTDEESSFGIIVDQVNEVVGVPVTSIDPPPSFLNNGSHLKGIGKLNNGKRLIIVMDPSEIIMSSGLPQKIGSGSGQDLGLALKLKERSSLDELQLVTLKIGNEEFGINIMNVQEIIRLTEITVIPGAPFYVKGVVNLRGNVLPVLDLRARFEMEERELTSSERIVVTTYRGKATGLIVDAVMEVLQISTSDIEPSPEIISGVRSMFIDGIAKKDDGKRFIIILSIAEILGITEPEEDLSEIMDDFDSAISGGEALHKTDEFQLEDEDEDDSMMDDIDPDDVDYQQDTEVIQLDLETLDPSAGEDFSEETSGSKTKGKSKTTSKTKTKSKAKSKKTTKSTKEKAEVS